MPSDLILHLDMDGVLTDFVTGFKKISGGIPPDEYRETYGRKAEAELFLNKGGEFFAGLDWIEGGLELLKFALANFKVVRILTSAGTGKDWNKFKEVAGGKLGWLQAHAPMLPKKNIIIVPFPSLKARHSGLNRILVDDKDTTITAWQNQGGIGLLHHHSTWQKTIGDLQGYASNPISLKEIVASLK